MCLSLISSEKCTLPVWVHHCQYVQEPWDQRFFVPQWEHTHKRSGTLFTSQPLPKPSVSCSDTIPYIDTNVTPHDAH